MSQPLKEPGFFLPFNVIKDYYAKKSILLNNRYHLLSTYMLKNYNRQALIGESSTFYTNDDFNHKDLINNIHQYNPKMKFIYIIRNPIDRVISHYLHEIKMRNINLDINTFITSRQDVLGICNYKKQLAPYLKHFNPNQIYPILFEDMTEANWSDSELFEFLQIEALNAAVYWDNNSYASDKKDDIRNKINRSHLEKLSTIKQEQMNYFSNLFGMNFIKWSSFYS